MLDPACGSGNFLYVALHLLLNLEKEVITYAAGQDVGLLPQVRPTQLAGIEINPYAQQLAQVVIWIGYLQWMRDNGFNPPRNPVLEPIQSIQRMDAILDLSDPAYPHEPEWPAAEFIVGNPPFLGGSRILEELGREYQHAIWRIYAGRVAGAADLCCYWFEKARSIIARYPKLRCGLLATQSIRGGVNRGVLERIKESGDIFFAVSDRDWILDGANVHVSLVGFDDSSEIIKSLDGRTVPEIFANLTAAVDVTKAKPLARNTNIGFVGTKKAGEFNVPFAIAETWLRCPNPHGRPNSDVLVPWVNGASLVGRANQWIIDAGASMSLNVFSCYEKPYTHALERVKPERERNKEERTKRNWWLFKRSAPDMRAAISGLRRYLAVVRHAKHRIFVWVDPSITCDDGIVVFASSDDLFFGVLQSRAHAAWVNAQGTQVRERESGFRYTPTTCFETFPFPEVFDNQREAIAEAAKELDRLRNGWLNPPEWTREEVLEFPGSVDGPWARYVQEPDSRGIGTVRYPRVVARDEECAKELKKRTLTNLYNQRPTWLDLAHKKLDAAVFAAYGWDPSMTDDDLLAALLALNLERASETDPQHAG